MYISNYAGRSSFSNTGMLSDNSCFDLKKTWYRERESSEEIIKMFWQTKKLACKF